MFGLGAFGIPYAQKCLREGMLTAPMRKIAYLVVVFRAGDTMINFLNKNSPLRDGGSYLSRWIGYSYLFSQNRKVPEFEVLAGTEYPLIPQIRGLSVVARL
jgi:hypothetical protein